MCEFEKWITQINWLAVLTVLIAAFVAYVALQQWRTAAHKVKLDLFDRRYRIFEEMRNMLGKMGTVGPNIDQVFNFWANTRGTEFLFGSEIQEYRREIFGRARIQSNAKEDIVAAVNSGGSVEDHPKEVEIRRKGETWASSELDKLADKFNKYLYLSKL